MSKEICEQEAHFARCNTLKVTLLGTDWSLSAGGLSTINRELAIQLSQLPKVDVSFYIPKGHCTFESKKEAQSHGVTVVEAQACSGFNSLEWLTFPPKCLRMDVIVGNGVKLGQGAQVLRDVNRCKWFQVVHTAPERLGEHEVNICECADLVVPIGPEVKKAYSSYLQRHTRDQEIFTVIPGLFDREFGGLEQFPNENGEFKVLLFGRGDDEDKQKGYDIAAKAFSDDRLKGKPYQLIFVGAPDGKQEAVLEKLIQCGITKEQLTVRRFPGRREMMIDLLPEVDLCIMPSKSEGFGLVSLEALSAGLPILVGSKSGFARALENIPMGKSCIVDSDDPAKWAEAIEGVRVRHRVRLEEIKLLRASYKKKYNWREQCEALVEAMCRTVHGPSSNAVRIPGVEFPVEQMSTTVTDDDVDKETKGKLWTSDIATNNTFTSETKDCSDNEPPQLSVSLPSMNGFETVKKDPREAPLPVDFLLLTVKECEFLACYMQLVNPFRCWYDNIGYVYFEDIGGDQDEKVKVALIRFYEGSSGPGGALVALKNAVPLLRPKAIISVGTCSSLNPEEARLGDVVVSGKLKELPKSRSYVSRRFLTLIKHAADGFVAPLQNREAHKVKVHCHGEFLSGPEVVSAESQRKLLAESFPQAVGIVSEGIFAVAYDNQIEWLIVKGIADYADGAESTTEIWSPFASVMAASLVAHILMDPMVFRSWPHCHTEGDASSHLQSSTHVILKRKWPEEDEDMSFDLQSPSQVNSEMEKMKSRQHADAPNPVHLTKKNRQPCEGDEKAHSLVPLLPFFSLSDIFTRLRIVTKETFRSHEGCQKQQPFLIEGAPGLGKTTYCQKRTVDCAAEPLLEDSSLMELIENPLNVALLRLLCKDFEGDLPESKTQLYWAIVQDVLQRFEEKNGLSSRSEDLIKVYNKELLHLGRAALQSLLEGRSYLEEHEFGVNSGLLSLSIQGGDSESIPCNRYGFFHHSFQEFFSALYLAFQILDGEIECDSVVSDERYLNLNQVFLFMSGIVASQCEETAVALVNSMTAQINSLGSKSDTRVHSFLQFAFDCLSECTTCIAEGSRPRLVHTFGRNLSLATLQVAGVKHIELLLKALLVNSSLTSLHLHGDSIGDTGAECLSQALTVNSSLTNLDLTSNSIGDTGAESLSQALTVNSSLTNLHLTSNRIGYTGAECLSQALTVNSSLTNLDLTSNRIGGTGAEFLSGALKVNSSLTNLDLSENSIGDPGAVSLSQALSANSSLTNLNLSGNGIGLVGGACLSHALIVNSSLTDLELSRNSIGDAGAESLFQALTINSSLTNLNLNGNSIGDAGASSLSWALAVNSFLSILDLSENCIGAAGATFLSKALVSNCSLTTLDLNGNGIGDPGAVSLSSALAFNSSLTHLNLGENFIGDDGAKSLSFALTANSSLSHLDLGINIIDDKGAASLCQALTKNFTLTFLDLRKNSIRNPSAFLPETLKINGRVNVIID